MPGCRFFTQKDLIFDAVQPEKFFGAMLMPLPLLMLLMGLALLLLWFTRWQKAVRRFYAELAVLLLFSLQPVADRLLRPIEANTRLIAATIRSVTSWCWAGLYLQSRLGAQLEFARQQPAARDGRRAALPCTPRRQNGVYRRIRRKHAKQRRHGGAGGRKPGRAAQHIVILGNRAIPRKKPLRSPSWSASNRSFW